MSVRAAVGGASYACEEDIHSVRAGAGGTSHAVIYAQDEEEVTV